MDESVKDETSVRPVRPGEVVPERSSERLSGLSFASDHPVERFRVISTRASGSGVEEVRPVTAWCGSLCITFWNGMAMPDPVYVAAIRSAGLKWPLVSETPERRASLFKKGVLDGIYYLEDHDIRCVHGSL